MAWQKMAAYALIAGLCVATSGCASPTDQPLGINAGTGGQSDSGAGTGGTTDGGGSDGKSGSGGTGGKATGGSGGTGANPSCAVGTADCDGDESNGCETKTDTDDYNCGACGNHCTMAHSSGTCEKGVCVVDCLDSWGDCDSDPTNGCEAPLNSTDNCHACGTKCSSNGPNSIGVCASGGCESQCSQGFDDCDSAPGCETAVSSDVNNCGACGHSCGTLLCVNGECQPITVFEDSTSSPAGLALDTNSVYWTDSGLDRVMKAPKAGGSSSVIAQNTVSPYGIAVDATSVYWASDTDEAIWKAPVGGGTPQKLATIPTNGTTAGLAINGSTLYWLGADALRATPLAGGSTTVVATTTVSTSLTLAIDSGQAYWTSWSDQQVLRAPISGGTPSVLTSASYPNDIDVDATNLYYGDDSGLWKMPKAGGTPVKLVATTLGVYNLATDGTYVFYSDGSDLWRVALAGGSPIVIQSGASVSQIRVDSGFVYWTDGTSGSVLKLPK